MKIYNEITLEWNEDTKRYDKVVSEDSYEYDGELELAQEYGTFGGASKLAAGTMGRITQWDLLKQAAEQAKKFGRYSGLSSLLGTGVGVLASGLGPLGFAAGKGLTNLLSGAMYQPKDFKSKTGWGQNRTDQLSQRERNFQSGQIEGAATGFARDALLSFMFPKMFEKMGGKVKDKLSGLFGDAEVIDLAEDVSTQPMTSLGGKAPTAQSFDTKLDWVRDVLGGDVTGGRPARGGYNLASSLEGAVPGMEFGGRTALGGGPAQLSLEDLRSALPPESLASVFGQLGGAVPSLGTEVHPGNVIPSEQYNLMAPEVQDKMLQELIDSFTKVGLAPTNTTPFYEFGQQFGLSEPPAPYEPPISQGIQQSPTPWQGFQGVPLQFGR